MEEKLGDMGMLKELSLKRYKCFETLESLPLAPLTILCGTNSSGKSSIINSILLQKQYYEMNNVTNRVPLNGELVKEGKFQEICTGGKNTNVQFGLKYELRKPKRFVAGKKGNISPVDVTAYKNLSNIFRTKAAEFSVVSEVVLKAEGDTGNCILDEQKLVISFKSGSKLVKSKILLKRKRSNKYDISMNNIPDPNSEDLVDEVYLTDASCYFENACITNVFATKVTPKGLHIAGILANLYLILKMHALQFKNVNYLTPLRVYPKHNYLTEENDVTNINGESMPYIIQSFDKRDAEFFYPPSDDKFPASCKLSNFKDCVNSWMQYLGLGEYDVSSSEDVIKLKISGYNIANSGFGNSQVLPILVQELTSYQNETLLLEQPEIHLHPIAQMGIADFLIAAAMNGNNSIVETHSDHIINRVVRRMMEDEKIHNLVKIYFVNKVGSVSKIEEVKVDPECGVMIDNEEFFTQFASETERMIDIALKNQQQREKNEGD